MNSKKWKDHLLSSGVPLEHSVVEILKGHQLVPPREHKYERTDETGIRKLFSIDVHASKIFLATNLWLELFIECKYRHNGTAWVFAPDSYDWFFGRSFRDAFMVLDDFSFDTLDKDMPNKFASKYPLCSKGIEILKDGANPKSIEQSVQQLRFGSASKVADCIENQVMGLLGEKAPIFVLVPIIAQRLSCGG